MTQTIPRLEMIGTLLLARLMNTDTLSLREEITLQQPVCYCDSRIALYWIYGLERDWKPLIQNRAEEISVRKCTYYLIVIVVNVVLGKECN